MQIKKEMTFEELKAEAEKQGYMLVKKQTLTKDEIKIFPCSCGSEKIYHFFGFRYDGFNCGICGKESLSRKGASEREKIKDWNKQVKND